MKSKKVTTSNELNRNSLGANVNQFDVSKRDQMIATAAYFRAEKRGFSPNNDLADWFESEVEVDSHLNSCPP